MHSDITAISIETPGRSFVIVSVYIPCSTNQKEIDKEAITTQLNLISKVFTEKMSQHPDTEFILMGDFNQWDSHWGGDHLISHAHQGKGQKMFEFMADFNLVQLLRRGTPIYHSSSGASFTIDLVFTSDRLAQTRLGCKLHKTHHGSDHEAIEIEFDITTPDTIIPP